VQTHRPSAWKRCETGRRQRSANSASPFLTVIRPPVRRTRRQPRTACRAGPPGTHSA
jgi:hypothetical protein